MVFNGVQLCEGIIKDISTSGMRLFIPKRAWLPQEFEVVTPVLDQPLRVRTTWTDGERIGVKFVFDKQ